MLEIQYENEVGTGLGPTLEFYALVSTELQKSELGLWNDSDSYKNQQVMAEVVKVTLEELRSSNNNSDNNTVLNNNQINMLIEQHQSVTETRILDSTTAITTTQGSASSDVIQYVNAPHGLFPTPLSKTAKTSQISRLKFKFKFLGKFMAKAVMDSRMVINYSKLIFSLLIKNYSAGSSTFDTLLSLAIMRRKFFELSRSWKNCTGSARYTFASE